MYYNCEHDQFSVVANDNRGGNLEYHRYNSHALRAIECNSRLYKRCDISPYWNRPKYAEDTLAKYPALSTSLSRSAKRPRLEESAGPLPWHQLETSSASASDADKQTERKRNNRRRDWKSSENARLSEKRRTSRLKKALDELRLCLPSEFFEFNGKPLSKIQTLRMAASYIEALAEMLRTDRNGGTVSEAKEQASEKLKTHSNSESLHTEFQTDSDST